MKTGYPYLAIAKKYNVPYREVLHVVEYVLGNITKLEVHFTSPIINNINKAMLHFKAQQAGTIPMTDNVEIS